MLPLLLSHALSRRRSFAVGRQGAKFATHHVTDSGQFFGSRRSRRSRIHMRWLRLCTRGGMEKHWPYLSVCPPSRLFNSRNLHTHRPASPPIMKRTAPWRATAVAAAALGSHTACAWVGTTGGRAFGPQLSRGSIRTVGGSLASSSAGSTWTSRHAACRSEARRARTSVTSNGLRMQVWSNPQAVQDYKDLLDGVAPEDTIDQPSVIVGRGKMGTALASMGMGEDLVLGRGEDIPLTLPYSSGKGDEGEDGAGTLKHFPIYVCVPEEEVAAVIDSCPDEKREDLVFLSSGCLEPLLKARGMCRGEQTQATLYFTVDKVGGRAVDHLSVIGTDGRGEAKLAGETAVCGKWKGAFAMRLEQSQYDLHCSTEYYLEWRRVMFEKLIFDCAVNLVGSLHKFPTVGHVTEFYTEEVVDMLFELKNTLRSTLAVSLMNGYPERLIAYGQDVGDSKPTRMDARTFKWYNQFFYDISNTALKANFDDPCPMHTEYLNYGKDKGIFTF